jgi:agmatinase
MIKSIINTNDKSSADVLLVSAPYEKTASFHKGTALGPQKVIECLNTQIEFFDRRYRVDSTEIVKVAHTEIAGLENMNPEQAHNAVVDTCKKSTAPFVFLLGGEHSMSYGAFQALTEKYNPKDITIVQIDAHCDLRKDDGDYTEGTPTPFAHSAVMRRAHEMGYNLVQVGIRAYCEDEFNYFSSFKNIKVFEWGLGAVPKISKILGAIKTKMVYISIDVDGIDPSFMPGTGTPVQGGLEWYYTLNLLEKIIEKKNLVGADIVEVSPTPDSVLTEYGSAQVVYNMINTYYKKRLLSQK